MGDVSSKQATKKTVFTVDLIIMVGLAKVNPNYWSNLNGLLKNLLVLFTKYPATSTMLE